MGYSLSVSFKNKANAMKMKDFYEKNEDLIRKMALAELGKIKLNKIKIYDLTTDLSYGPNKNNLLGFDVGSGYPYYLKLLCAWFASKTNKENLNIYYDDEKINILLNGNEIGISVGENGLMTKKNIDNIGYKLLLSQLYYLESQKEIDDYFSTIESLFYELNERWIVFS